MNTELCSICNCISGEKSDDVRNGQVNDGYCNDENNNAICNYDGGDCCLSKLNTDHCSACVCFTTGVITSPGFPRNYAENLRLYYSIEVPTNEKIAINFMSFDVDTGGLQGTNYDCL